MEKASFSSAPLIDALNLSRALESEDESAAATVRRR